MKSRISLRAAHRKMCTKRPHRIPFSRRIQRLEPATLVAVSGRSLRDLLKDFPDFFDPDKSENNCIRLDAFARKTHEPYWSLLYRQPRKKKEDEEERSLGELGSVLPPYLIVPTAHAVVTGIITHRMVSGQVLFRKRAVVTATRNDHGHPICVQSTEDGIIVFPQLSTWYNRDIGLAVARKPNMT